MLVHTTNGYAQVLEEASTAGGTPTMSYILGDDALAQTTSSGPSYLLWSNNSSTSNAR